MNWQREPRGSQQARSWAIFGGHISGRRLRGVKINPLFKDQESGGEAEGEGGRGGPGGESIVRWYDSFPRLGNPAPPSTRHSSSDTDLQDLVRTPSGFARELRREPSRHSVLQHAPGKGKGKGKKSKPPKLDASAMSGSTSSGQVTISNGGLGRQDVPTDAGVAESVPGSSGLGDVTAATGMPLEREGAAMTGSHSSPSSRTTATLEILPRPFQHSVRECIPEESQTSPPLSPAAESALEEAVPGRRSPAEAVHHSDGDASTFPCDEDGRFKFPSCGADSSEMVVERAADDSTTSIRSDRDTENRSQSDAKLLENEDTDLTHHVTALQSHGADCEEKTLSCSQETSDKHRNDGLGIEGDAVRTNQASTARDESNKSWDTENDADADRTSSEGRLSPSSLILHDCESSEHTLIYTSDEEYPGSLMDTPTPSGHWASDSDWLDHDSVAMATEDAVSLSSAFGSGVCDDARFFGLDHAPPESQHPGVEMWSSDLSAALHALPDRGVKPILLSSSSEDGSDPLKRMRCPSSLQDHKTVTFAAGTLFNEDKPKRYQKERINLRELYRARVGSDLSVARINPLFIDDDDTPLEEEDDDSSFCLTDDEKAARGSGRHDPSDSVSSLGSASLLSYQTTDLNTPVYMQRYLQQLQESAAIGSRESTLSQTHHDPSASRCGLAHDSTEALYDLPPQDHLVGQGPLAADKEQCRRLARWGALTLLVLSVAAIIIGIGVYFGRQPDPG